MEPPTQTNKERGQNIIKHFSTDIIMGRNRSFWSASVLFPLLKSRLEMLTKPREFSLILPDLERIKLGAHTCVLLSQTGWLTI